MREGSSSWKGSVPSFSPVYQLLASTFPLHTFFPSVHDLRLSSLVIFLLVSPKEYIYIFLSNYSYLIFSLLSHIYPSCGLHRQFLLSFSGCHDC